MSPVKTSVPSTSSESIPRGVARRVQRAHAQAADLELLVGQQVAGGAVDEAALLGVDQDLGVRPALLERVELGDVVVVVVGEQDVGDVEAVLVGLGDQRRDGPAGVDDERVAAGPAATR